MAKKRKKSKSKQGNPLLEKQQAFLQSLSDNDRDNYFSNSLVDPERRGKIWMDQSDVGSELVDKYSWATPDDRALRILQKFSPIVEIGCGANAYWCRVMKGAGVDVVGYDIKPQEGGKIDGQKKEVPDHDFTVLNGGPEILKKEHLKKRTLFLCYPDEDAMPEAGDDGEDEEPQSLGSACLEHFQGTHVIHVGELYGDTLSMDQAPWGRSSGSQFQERLSTEYHCLLKARLTNWLHVRDTISVWKRSEVCSIVFAAEDDDDEEEEVEYKHIPKDERLPIDAAAPCLAYLLSETNGDAKIPTELPIAKIEDSLSQQSGRTEKSDTANAKSNTSKTKSQATKETITAKLREVFSPKSGDNTSEETKKGSQNPQSKLSTTTNDDVVPLSSGKKKKKKQKRKRSDSLASAKSASSKTEHACPW